MLNSSFVPNLPGFKPHDIHTSGKKTHYLKITKNGERFIEDTEGEGKYDLNASASVPSLGSTSPGKHYKASSSAAEILKFDADFDRTRKASILYYTEDNSIKIIEVPQPNSGINQGIFLRRSVAPRSDGSTLSLDEFRIGESVTIFGRDFYITDCNNATREYLKNHGRYIPPSDKYDNINSMKNEMNSHKWGQYHSKKNNLKQFMEAKLGNTVNTSGREGFMDYGNKTLKFLCSWDDREALYGDRQDYVLVYHLADNTIEVFVSSSSAAKQFPKLLRRAPLPKFVGSSSLIGDESNADGSPLNEVFYHWSDFYIGAELNVYSRLLTILDADSTTKQFYIENESPLGEPIRLDADAIPFTFAREIPPHTGFGSEEDSLKSCFGPLNPTSVVSRSNITETRVFSYFANLIHHSDTNDTCRKFVISFYKQDGTVKIQEPPTRNSGFVGGLFLSRRKVKNLDTNEYMNERDFRIGKRVQVLTHTFEVTGANEFTLKYMDSVGLLDEGKY